MISSSSTRPALLGVGLLCILSLSVYMLGYIQHLSVLYPHAPKSRPNVLKTKTHIRTKLYTCPSKYQIRKFLFQNGSSEDEKNYLDLHTYIYRPTACFNTIIGNHSLVILVKSAVAHVKSREIIRKTWAGHGRIQTYFVLGLDGAVTQSEVDKEHSKFNDIIQMNFVDSYKNNTIKLMFSFDFVIKHCPEVTLVLFIDDDFLLETDKFKDFVLSLEDSNSNYIFEGFKIDAFAIRNNNSKWFVSEREFPFLRWPSYLAGGSYVASRKTIMKCYEQFRYIRYFGIDDAWLGIVAKYVGILPKDNKKFHNSGFFHQEAFIKHCHQNLELMEESWEDIAK